MYTDEVELQEDEVFELFYVSKKYMIQTLIVECNEFLGQSIDIVNFDTILNHSILFDEEGLQSESLDFIEKNIEKVIESENFLELSYESLLYIVKSETLRIAELGLIQAAMRWTDAQCKHKEMEPSKDNRISILKDILHHLRFASLTPETIVKFNEMFNLFNTEEVGEMIISKFASADKEITTPWVSLARESNVTSVCFIAPNQSYSKAYHSTFNIHIECSKDIMIHAVKLSTPGKKCSDCYQPPDTTATVTVNGQHSIFKCKADEGIVKLSNPVLVKEKIIKIEINFYNNDCKHSFAERSKVYPMKEKTLHRGVTFTCPDFRHPQPLMAIRYARYYK